MTARPAAYPELPRRVSPGAAGVRGFDYADFVRSWKPATR